MDELRDANGDRPSIEWFNSGSKYHKNRLEYVFVGSTFAVFAGNLSRKDLNTEGEDGCFYPSEEWHQQARFKLAFDAWFPDRHGYSAR